MVSRRRSASHTRTHTVCVEKRKKKKETDGQTCSGHETTQSKVQPELECFDNDEQGGREDKEGGKKKSPFLTLATQKQLLVSTSSFLQCVWI